MFTTKNLSKRLLTNAVSSQSSDSSYKPNLDTSKDKNAKPIFTAHFDGLVDLVEFEGRPAFFIKEEGHLKVLPHKELNGQRYLPPPKDQIPWILPRASEVLNYHNLFNALEPSVVDSNLFEDLIAYHKEISELPSEEYYILLAAWVMHTYLMESFDYSPILLFFAVPERGKSRTGKGLVYVAYRGVHTETLNEANLFRLSENQRATLFLDVRDLWNKAEKRGSDDILLSRIERGCKVSRVLWPERGAFRDTKIFDVFGPTIIATNESIHPILETRCISITLPDTMRDFEGEVSPENALPLKERLTEFRFRHLGELLPEVPKLARGRLGDILKPLTQIIELVNPKRIDEFMDLVSEIERARKLEKLQSFEAQLIQAIVELDFRVNHGYLPVLAITDRLNMDKPERQNISPQKVGRRLKALGFERGRTEDGASSIYYDIHKIDLMMSNYGLKETSVSPVTPVRSKGGAPI